MNSVRETPEDFLLGVAEATNALIAEKLDKGINKAMEVLTVNLGVSAGFVFVNHKKGGKTLTSMKYFWSVNVIPERVVHNQNLPVSVLGEVWDVLKSGGPYELRYSDSKHALREHMGLDGTKSVILFPVLVEGVFWGVLGIVDFRYEREWTRSEKSLLESFSNSIGGAVCRHRLEKHLEKQVAKRTRQLEDSRLRFQLAVEGSQDGIWDWQPLKKKSYWSPRLYEQLGYEPNEFPSLGDDFFDIVHSEDVEGARRSFERHLHNREPYEVEFRLQMKSGDYRWFKSTCQAQWNARGQATRVVGSHEDIHEQKLNQEKLRKQQARFRAVILDAPNAIFLVQQSGHIQLQSNKATEIFGYSAQEFEKLTIHDLIPGAHRSAHKKHLEAFFENPKSRLMGQGMDLKGRKKNGKPFWVEVGLSPMVLDGETLVVAVVTDITKRRRAELDLKESHRKMNDLVNNLPGMVYRCLNYENWPMEYLSAACEAITGYTPTQFYGDPSDVTYGDLIHVDDRADVWEQVQQSLRARESFRVIYRIIDKDHKEKWLWEQGNGVFRENGTLEALEGCIFDITPIVRSQERVNQAIYNAEDRERRRIASDIHDGLQQTLSVSALNLQYLEEEIGKLTEGSRERFEKSKTYLEKGISESRNIAHQLMPKSIHDLGLDKALQDLASEVQLATGIQCSYYCNLRERLDQKTEIGLFRMAQEALNNVIKSAEAKHVNVQLICTEDHVQLMIEDDGVGFDKNKLDLYKAGFGLTGMKNRISALSGSLTIDSTPGRGTSVIALIPLNHTHE